MRTPACAALLLLGLSAQALQGAIVSGTVTDVTGAAVQDALVVAVDNQARANGPAAIAGPLQRTSRAGVFHLQLNAGFYDLCVFSAGFSASCQKIYVRTGASALHRKIKLSVDPLVMKERGDVFQ